MMKHAWIFLVLLVAGGAAAGRLAGDAAFWRHYGVAASRLGPDEVAATVEPRLVLAGAPAPQPVGTADSEHIAPEALQQAGDLARAAGTRALIVHRHGHRILEVFGQGSSNELPVTGGELAPAIMSLALGPVVDSRRVTPEAAVQAIRAAIADDGSNAWRNPWSSAARQRFTLQAPPQLLLEHSDGSVIETLSRRVWQPLQAADAAVWGRDEGLLRLDCCVVAALGDWMRVGDLLLQQGVHHGERLISADWIRALLPADAEGRRHPAWLHGQRPWSGDEPPAARDTFWFDLGRSARLWLVPRRGLAVLHWAESPKAASDTEIPNLLIRGLLDQALPIDAPSALEQMVPGH